MEIEWAVSRKSPRYMVAILVVPLGWAGFPEKDRAKATEAMQLYKDAVRLLDRLVNMKVEYCKAIYGFFSANSEGDTIRMGDIALPLLRQQVKKRKIFINVFPIM